MSGLRLFVGGDFTSANGTTTGGLIALSPTTGAIDTVWTGRIAHLEARSHRRICLRPRRQRRQPALSPGAGRDRLVPGRVSSVDPSGRLPDTYRHRHQGLRRLSLLCRNHLGSATGVLWVGTPPPGVTNPPVFASSPHTWVSAFDSTTGQHVPAFLPNVTTSGAGIWAVGDAGGGCLWLGGAITKVNDTTLHRQRRGCRLSGVQRHDQRRRHRHSWLTDVDHGSGCWNLQLLRQGL